MITLDRLSLQLPSGMEHRGRDIAQQIARQLYEQQRQLGLTGNINIEHLNLVKLHLQPELSNRQIAASITLEITTQIQHHNSVDQRPPAAGINLNSNN